MNKILTKEFNEAWNALNEAENINKDSSFKRGVKYDSVEDKEDKIGLNTDLELINNAISDTEVDFFTLARLFDIYINNRDLITDQNANIAKQIWQKIKNILDNKKDNLPELAGFAWYKKLQYYYNAYVTEEAVAAGIPDIEYGTSSNEHNVLYSDKDAVDLPDFKNFMVGNIPMTLEVKNYGSLAKADSFIKSEDRKEFHNADFILIYLMAQKRWLLAYNSQTTKYYRFENLPLQKPHISITIDSDNKIQIAEWK